MGYFYYRLSFSTPVHFGQAEMGGNLERNGHEFSSDSLFSAICTELAEQGEAELLQQIVSLTQNGEFRLSDLFPYQDVDGDEMYFLPRPFLFMPGKSSARLDMKQAMEISKLRKVSKKQPYIRISEIPALLAAMQQGHLYVPKDELKLGNSSLVERVNCRQEENPLPYYVGQFTFNENTGLFGIVQMPENFFNTFYNILQSLGLSGIGGKRSGGYGKFMVDGLFEFDDSLTDIKLLLGLLNDDQAPTQMTISIFKPMLNEMDQVKQGQYQLKKRSGFTGHIKRDSVYMVSAGSCFSDRLQGELLDIGNGTGHPIWRYGKGLYVGLNI